MNYLSLFILFLLSSVFLNAQYTLVEKTFDKKTSSKITLTLLTSGVPPAGYVAVQAEVINKTKVPRQFTFDFSSGDSDYSGTGNSLSSSDKLYCGALKSVRKTYIVPVVTVFNNSTYNTIFFKLQGTGTGMAPFEGEVSTSMDEGWPSVLIGSKLKINNGSILDREVELHLSSRSSVIFGSTFDASNASEDWRSYIGHDLICLTDEEWLRLSPGSRNAILKWIRHGGGMRLFTESSASAKSLGLPASENQAWGSIKIIPLPATGLIENPKALIKEIAAKLSRQKGPFRMSHQRSDFRNSWQPQVALGKKAFNVLFFILVLIAFAVLVGPVNLFVFAKAGERHKLFITTPIISAIASALLLLLIFFQDGFGGKGTRQLLIETNPGAGENTTHIVQEQFSRTGVLLSTGFEINEPAVATPVLIADSRWARATALNNGGNSRYNFTVNDQSLDLSGDWFQSRSEQGHLIETIRPSRERIEVSGTAKAPRLGSTFGYPIDLLYYCDENGDYWRAENISSKKKAKLSPVTEKHVQAWALKQAKSYAKRQQTRIEKGWNRKGHFIAYTETAPGIETLKSIKWDTTAIISGPVSR